MHGSADTAVVTLRLFLTLPVGSSLMRTDSTLACPNVSVKLSSAFVWMELKLFEGDVLLVVGMSNPAPGGPLSCRVQLQLQLQFNTPEPANQGLSSQPRNSQADVLGVCKESEIAPSAKSLPPLDSHLASLTDECSSSAAVVSLSPLPSWTAEEVKTQMGSWPVLPWQLALGCWASSQNCPFVSPPAGLPDDFDPTKITVVIASELSAHVNVFKVRRYDTGAWNNLTQIQTEANLPIDKAP
ncbi:unnamed protein product [Leuciscus chuanchicus]